MKKSYPTERQDKNHKKTNLVEKNQQLHCSPYTEEYLKYFQEIKIPSRQQIRKILSKNGVKYKNNENNLLNICYDQIISVVKRIKYSQNSQIVNLYVQIGNFSSQIIILNVNGQSPVHEMDLLGKGSFGYIYTYSFRNTQNTVTKCINLDKSNADIFERGLLLIVRQYFFCKICSALKIGPHLSKVFGFDIICYNDCAQFQMELCYQINQNQSKERFSTLKQSLKLLHYLNIVHRDIKTQNILYSSTYSKLVFIDFGNTRNIQENIGYKSMTRYCGTYSFTSQQMSNAFLKKQPQWIDLYYNDLHALKVVFKVRFNYKEKFVGFPPLGIVGLLYLIKYLIYSDQIEKLQTLLTSSVKKILYKQILNFLLEVNPTQRLRNFYLRHFEYKIGNQHNILLQQTRLIYSKQYIKTFELPKQNKKAQIFQTRFNDNSQQVTKILQFTFQSQKQYLQKILNDIQFHQELQIKIILKVCQLYLNFILHSINFYMDQKVQISIILKQKLKILKYWKNYQNFWIPSVKTVYENLKNIGFMVQQTNDKDIQLNIFNLLIKAYTKLLHANHQSLIILNMLMDYSMKPLQKINWCITLFFTYKRNSLQEKIQVFRKVQESLLTLECIKQEEIRVKQYVIKILKQISEIILFEGNKDISDLILMIDQLFNENNEQQWSQNLMYNIQIWISSQFQFNQILSKYNYFKNSHQMLTENQKLNLQLPLPELIKFYLKINDLLKIKLYVNKFKKMINLNGYFQYLYFDLLGELSLKEKNIDIAINYYNIYLQRYETKDNIFNEITVLSKIIQKFCENTQILAAECYITKILQLLDSIDNHIIKYNAKAYYPFYTVSIAAFIYLKYTQNKLNSQYQSRINKFGLIFGQCCVYFQLMAKFYRMKSQISLSIEYYRKAQDQINNFYNEDKSLVSSNMELTILLINKSKLDREEAHKRAIQSFNKYKNNISILFSINSNFILLTLKILLERNQLQECCQFIKNLSRYSSLFHNSNIYQKYYTVTNKFVQICSYQNIVWIFSYLQNFNYYSRKSIFQEFSLFVALVLYQYKLAPKQQILNYLKRITLTFMLISNKSLQKIKKQYYLIAAQIQINPRKIKNYFYKNYLKASGKERPFIKIMKKKNIEFENNYQRCIEQQKILKKHKQKYIKNIKKNIQVQIEQKKKEGENLFKSINNINN